MAPKGHTRTVTITDQDLWAWAAEEATRSGITLSQLVELALGRYRRGVQVATSAADIKLERIRAILRESDPHSGGR